jgi:plastocyanin
MNRPNHNRQYVLAAFLTTLLLTGAGCVPQFVGPRFLDAAAPTLDQAVSGDTFILNEAEEWEPAALRVPVGTTVTWINQAKVFMDLRPATFIAPYPYPEPDPPVLPPGEQYSTTYNEPGVFYFNHGYEAVGLVWVVEP